MAASTKPPLMAPLRAEFPDTNFAIIDMVVEQPNVRSVVFKEHEGSYLVGIIAAMASESGKVGFVGGMDAAGGTGRGVLQAAADAGILGIGVDSNQNGMFPGSVLTSMLKRVDVAVYNAFTDGTSDNFDTGFNLLGLAEGGVGYALDENNDALVTQAMRDAVNAAAEKIKSGELSVHDYTSDSSCPVM